MFEALRAGASGFLLKDAPADDLVDAIRVVAAGDALLDPGVTRRVIDAFVHRPARPVARRGGDSRADAARAGGPRPDGPRARPTPTSRRHLFVTEATTKTHVSNVLGKLDLRDRVQAVIFAYENGLVVAGESGVPIISSSGLRGRSDCGPMVEESRRRHR